MLKFIQKRRMILPIILSILIVIIIPKSNFNFFMPVRFLQSCKNKKEVNSDLFFQFVPPIGESYCIVSMIDHSIILKSNRHILV